MKTTTKKTPYVIVRSSGGVYFGALESRKGKECTLTHARHVRYWDSKGLLSLVMTAADLATKGCGTGSQLTAPVPSVTLTETYSIHDCSPAGAAALKAHP